LLLSCPFRISVSAFYGPEQSRSSALHFRGVSKNTFFTAGSSEDALPPQLRPIRIFLQNHPKKQWPAGNASNHSQHRNTISLVSRPKLIFASSRKLPGIANAQNNKPFSLSPTASRRMVQKTSCIT
jgi:hypothetical protein